MANLFQALIPLLSSIALLIAAVNSQSTSFTYDFYGDQPTTLTYQGAAHFPSDSTFLRLTQTNASGAPQPFSIGRVVYSTPVLFQSAGAQADFETTLKFIITPIGGSPGDGLTFFIAPVGYDIPAGSTGGNFGIFNPSGSSPSVFAVEIDVTPNPWDPNYRHVGIDIQSPTSVNVTLLNDVIFRQEVTARISYVEATKRITVIVTAGGETFEVSSTYDLGTVLPELVQVGLSAATGVLVSNFDVVSWYFTSTLVNNGAAGDNKGAYIKQIV